MKTFNNFISEQEKPTSYIDRIARQDYEQMFETQGYGDAPGGKQTILTEAAVYVGGQPPPKFGNVVVMAGGAASGKGTVLNNLILMQGRVFDPDALKSTAMKLASFAPHLQKYLPKGYDAKEVLGRKNPLADPEVVGAMHATIKDLKWDTTVQQLVFAALGDKSRLPNLIFDTTLASPTKLKDICAKCLSFDYDIKNIHLVWVLQPVEIALKQNASRARQVPQKILMGTHTGAAKSMASVIADAEKVQEYMDGEIWIVFNSGKDDMAWERPYNQDLGPFFSKDPIKNRDGSPVVDDYGNYVYAKQRNTIKRLTTRPVRLKDKGKPLDPNRLSNEIIAKICSYVPNGSFEV